jgi:phage terminase large subunit-like protein
MDRIVDPAEYLADYHSSKASRRDFANFKMYRLNIWQSSSNPFLDYQKWIECGESIELSRLIGLKCVIGMDLSRTRDMTALVLAAWDGGQLITKPYFFLPHEVAVEFQDLVDLLSWGKQGFIDLQSTECIDFAAVEHKIYEIHECVGNGLQAIIFDKIFADDLTQRIEDQLGIQRYHFPQTITHFALPTAELERMVLDGTLRHDNNPVQSWQAQHVTVQTDANQNMRPVKPSQGDWRKIDGMVALIMAIGGLMSEAVQPSVYEGKGVEVY